MIFAIFVSAGIAIYALLVAAFWNDSEQRHWNPLR